jgi:LysM repeat protein
MLEITHQKAHALLQVAADQSLGADEKSALDAHLAKCKECSAYARGLASMEVRLRRVLHAQWDMQRPNLDLQAITHPSQAKLIWNNLISQTHALGKVTIVAALVLGYVVIANLFGIRLPISTDETPTTVPTPSELSSALAIPPTPSAQFTLTGLTTQACGTITYVVQQNDTLAYIALQHGTTEEAILEYNNLKSNMVFTGMELAIPLCESTPSQTATTTITPLNGTIFPTQPE